MIENTDSTDSIDLATFLKGLEGQSLYTPLAGQVILESIGDDGTITVICTNGHKLQFSSCGNPTNGTFISNKCMLFLSKEYREWPDFLSDRRNEG